MRNSFSLVATLLFLFTLSACSKKHLPSENNRTKVEYESEKTKPATAETTSPTVKRPAVKSKATFPKIITVNDAAAKKAVDGRMYYDVQGKRYWKNFKDGKYYLFDKSMYNNPDFKPGDN